MASIAVIANPELVESTDANPTDLDIQYDFPRLAQFQIEVVSGTFNFNTEGDASSDDASYTAGEKVILTLNANEQKISFKAANSGETFKIAL